MNPLAIKAAHIRFKRAFADAVETYERTLGVKVDSVTMDCREKAGSPRFNEIDVRVEYVDGQGQFTPVTQEKLEEVAQILERMRLAGGLSCVMATMRQCGARRIREIASMEMANKIISLAKEQLGEPA